MRSQGSQEWQLAYDSSIPSVHGVDWHTPVLVSFIDWQSPVRVFSRWATHSPRLPQRTIAFLHSALTTATDGTRRELEPTSNIAVENAVPAAHGVDWQSPLTTASPWLTDTILAFLNTSPEATADGTWKELEPTSLRSRDSQERRIVSESSNAEAHGVTWHSSVRVL